MVEWNLFIHKDNKQTNYNYAWLIAKSYDRSKNLRNYIVQWINCVLCKVAYYGYVQKVICIFVLREINY